MACAFPNLMQAAAPTARFRDAIWSKVTRLSRSILLKVLIPRCTGSDALGGVVNMVTLSPSDFVDVDKRGHFSLKHGYRSRDRSHGVTATAAGFHETPKAC